MRFSRGFSSAFSRGFSSAFSRAIAGLSLLPLAIDGAAQESGSIVNASSSPELFSAGYLAQVLGSLLLVFVCLVGVIYFLKRVNRVGGGSGNVLRVLGSAGVGQREKIVLIEAGGEQLLIGVAQGSVRTLHVFPEPVVDTQGDEVEGPNFAAVLSAVNPLGSRS